MPPFEELFSLLTGYSPFPWQTALYRRFLDPAKLPAQCDIPTGLGKTNVMAIWLIARAHGAHLPRRLVYVVDRRAVVDQATEVAENLRKVVSGSPEFAAALGLGTRSLPISTMRGQHVDNKEWLADPATPAVIVGTVDMIGSRILFEGYGVTRKMRPYHAGLLGADTLIVLDESHLVPPFEKLLEAIAEDAAAFGPQDEALREIVPPFRLLPLSATGRTRSGDPFGLTEDDLEHPVVKQRLNAPKRLEIVPLSASEKLPEKLAS